MPRVVCDKGPKPDRGLTWIFSLGRPSEKSWRMLGQMVEEDLLDWVMFVLPKETRVRRVPVL